jgi:hypothetical protein
MLKRLKKTIANSSLGAEIGTIGTVGVTSRQLNLLPVPTVAPYWIGRILYTNPHSFLNLGYYLKIKKIFYNKYSKGEVSTMSNTKTI